jgi:2-hydroxycyclohexanecarboxyl-CoA dehydrogenase
MRLAGKSALITGGGAGIGAATALLFCAEGAAVTLVDRDAQALERTTAGIRRAHPRARVHTLEGDVADASVATRAVEAAVAAHGGLTVLVNNAAMRHPAAIDQASPDDWRAVVDVNLIGAAQFCRAATSALRSGGGASIVNVSSCYAMTGRPRMGLYDATKAALLALTRTLACEHAADGVRVNAVCPGSTLTEFHVRRAREAGKSVETLRGERSATSLLGRWAEPVEIARPILWLASDEASFITGATLMVDGGLSIL